MTSTSFPAGWVIPVSTDSDASNAIECAFAQWGRSLYRYFIVRTGGDTHLADDLMQQLYLRACRGAAEVPPAEMERWLRKVAKNLIREYWRKQARVPAHVPMAEQAVSAELAEKMAAEELPEEVWQRREARDQMVLAITALRHEEQELIVGHYFQNESHGSLASRLGISERAVEGRLYRARKALREELKHLDE
jgi:RNA polymerase sigma-70 factor (ECF subfamily)